MLEKKCSRNRINKVETINKNVSVQDLRWKLMNTKICKITQMQEEALTIEYGRNWKGKEKMTNKPSIWLEEACKLSSEIKLEIRAEGKNSMPLTKNVTLMEEAVIYFNIKGFTKEGVDQINHFRLHRKVCLTLEPVGEREVDLKLTHLTIKIPKVN